MAHREVESQQWIDRIEELVHRVELLDDPKARSAAVDLMEAVLKFHAAALERLMEIVAASNAAGDAIIDSIARDDLASSVLLLHGLHPDDLETRLSRAVEKLQRMLAERGAAIALAGVGNGTATLRIENAGVWAGAPLRSTIEAVIYQAVPEIERVVIDGLREPDVPDFVPLSKLTASSVV